MNNEAQTAGRTIRPYRPLAPGMGMAIAERTVLRTHENGERETWGEVAQRVAQGNLSLVPETPDTLIERSELEDHIAMGRVLMSGRHLQHGDENQASKPIELFSNCSTAALSSLKFYLLLNGSGVGRSYDDELMLVDWDNMPTVYCVLDKGHADRDGTFMTREEALPYYEFGRGDKWVRVADSREGWAKAVELIEAMAYSGNYKNKTLVLDFTGVRPKGSPIAGMQNRPSSGPVPFMEALVEIMIMVRGRGLPKWEQAMRVDHALAACVAVGGARRAARICIKNWRDEGIIDFINIKQTSGLWSANNSVGVDADFWEEARIPGTRANQVFEAICHASYAHGTGEPGIINLDRLRQDDTGFETYDDGVFAGNDRYSMSQETLPLAKALVDVVKKMKYPMIVNPCGEIPLLALGGYCVLADVVPFHADTLEQAREAFVAAARALVRVNKMQALYGKETSRTNRIGVGFTGIFEFAWKFFGLGFRDLLDNLGTAKEFWAWMHDTSCAVKSAAATYSQELGMNIPHTFTTVKPAGSVSKLFLLTEGAHLPAMAQYLRWVQFLDSDPLVLEYAAKGYPIKAVSQYPNVLLVGFPTQLAYGKLGVPEKDMVMASEATMEEQYKWLTLVEEYWLGEYSGQASFTLKYNTKQVAFETYKKHLLEWQPQVKCCSVMPVDDQETTEARYGYVPEEAMTLAQFEELLSAVQQVAEAIDMEALKCASGACPI